MLRSNDTIFYKTGIFWTQIDIQVWTIWTINRFECIKIYSLINSLKFIIICATIQTDLKTFLESNHGFEIEWIIKSFKFVTIRELLIWSHQINQKSWLFAFQKEVLEFDLRNDQVWSLIPIEEWAHQVCNHDLKSNSIMIRWIDLNNDLLTIN